MEAIALVNAYAVGRDLILFRRESDGTKSEWIKRAEFVSYLKASEVSPELRRKLEATQAVLSVKAEGDWYRVGWASAHLRASNASTRENREGEYAPLWRNRVTSYEADVSPVRRFLVDHDVTIQNPRSVYLDIETDSRQSFSKMRAGRARILCWSLVDARCEVVATGLLDEDSDDAEARLLTTLWKELAEFDRVIAWNSRFASTMEDTFDFQVIVARSRVLRVAHPDTRRWLWLDHCKTFMKMNLQVAKSGDEKQSMRLQDVSMAILGEGKDDFDGSKTWDAWIAGDTERARLLHYNLKDTVLMARIEKETGYLALLQSIAEACGIFPDSSAVDALVQIDTYLLRLGRSRGFHFGTMYRGDEDGKQFRGAYVMAPTVKGIVRNVHVCDFARLYPSIIISWNMSPETKVKRAPVNGPIPDGCCRTPTTGIVFDTRIEGILPFFLKEIAAKRKHWNDKKAAHAPGTPEAHSADRMSNGYKVLMNSAYGVIGSQFGRYFDEEIAEGVTQTGVYLIKRVISELQTRSWDVCYSDTDSCFCIGPNEQEFREAIEQLNRETLVEIAKRQGCEVCDVALAYEKEFERLVFTRGSKDEAVAKRYAGKYAHYKGKRAQQSSEPEIKGLEFKRGDSAELARRLQVKIIRMILGDWSPPYAAPIENAEVYRQLLARARDHVLKGKLKREEIVISKSLSRKPSEYVQKKKKDGNDAAQPPQVAVAKILAARGEDVAEGTRISYVVIDAENGIKAIPAQDFEEGHAFDRFYLWENLVWPPVQRVLAGAFPDQDWSEFDAVRPKLSRRKKGDTTIGLFVDTAKVQDEDAIRKRFLTVPVPRQSKRRPKEGPPSPEPYRITMTASPIERKARMESLKGILEAFPGTRPVILEIAAEGANLLLTLPQTIRVNDGFKIAIENWASAAF